jgi:hypothetical protein
MVIVVSLFSLGSGTALACALDRFPKQSAMIEYCSGLMLVAGLALIGGALPLFR